jgi:hypothetical protein
VAVVGYGKSALDMTTLAVDQGAQVHHVFRSPSWLIPEWILGAHFTYALFTRFGNIMMTSWAQPTTLERFLHDKLSFVIRGFWGMIQKIVKFQLVRNGRGRDQAAKDRLQVIQPAHSILMDFRSSGALGPQNYYPHVAEGRILPHHSEVSSFSRDGIQLKDGTEIPCDLVMLSVGYLMPKFPFLPAKYRALLENENGGTQLYRHLIHPRIPRLGFSGFNHGYMHVPAVEIGTQWLCAYFKDELELPSMETMERCMQSVRSWKLANMRFENAGMYAVSTRFQQYIDVLLKELNVSPYRKLPNVFAEIFGRYESSDYRGVWEEYERNNRKRVERLTSLPIDT